jgi:hypothetical protein
MNASELLEVATKMFVNQDQEAQKEAEWRMKKESRSPDSSIKWTWRAPFQSSP